MKRAVILVTFVGLALASSLFAQEPEAIVQAENLFPVATDNEMALSAIAKLESEERLSHKKKKIEKLQRLIESLVDASPIQNPGVVFSSHVIMSDEEYAISVGGAIFFTRRAT